jgi:hypothetical protein
MESKDFPAEEGDRFDSNLSTPNYTYHACGESFIAADGD